MEGACRQGHHHLTTNPNTSPQPVTEAAKQPKVTATTRPGLRSLSHSTQQPLSWLLAIPKTKQQREKKRAHQTHNPRPGGPNPEPHLHTRGNLWSPRSPPPPTMCGADSSAAHVNLAPPLTRSPPEGRNENGHSLRGRICQHTLRGRNGVKPCTSPAGNLTEFAAKSLTGEYSQSAWCQNLSLK